MRARCVRLSDAHWATVRKLAKKRGAALNIIVGEAIDMRTALPLDADLSGIVPVVPALTVSLAAQAKMSPRATRAAMARAWLTADGDATEAANILGATRREWTRALHWLPGLAGALKDILR